jgi:hybrid polyketide synthase/nonribosomal peptide synthetase ACE1
VSAPADRPKSILVTGGAGFLGRALLWGSIKNSHIERVHAVTVGQLEARLASGLLPIHLKITYYSVDLRKPRLSLCFASASSIFADINAVVHNGADASHLESYYTLRRAVYTRSKNSPPISVAANSLPL